MHISILSSGTKPTAQCCTSCCSMYHCPLCLKFKPTKLCKLQKHLEAHIRGGILFKDKVICRCGLDCRHTEHYHCAVCSRTILRRADMTKHLESCQGAVTAVSTQQTPPATQGAVTAVSTQQTPPATHQETAAVSSSSSSASTEQNITSASPVLLLQQDTVSPSGQDTDEMSSVLPAATENRGLPLSLQKKKCRHCNIFKKNMAKHIHRAHSGKSKDITVADHLKSKELRRKWENLRTVYNRYKKTAPCRSSGALQTSRQQWIISRMSFIEPHTKRKESQSNLPRKELCVTAVHTSDLTESSSAEDSPMVEGNNMAVNESCRLCERNLRVGGVLTNCKLIFDKKEQDDIASQLSKLGLIIENTPLRSYRVCRKCYTTISRLLRDNEVLLRWKEKETAVAAETCLEQDVTAFGSTDKRDRETTPPKTPRAVKKSRTSADLPVPTRSSVTECSIIARSATDHTNSVTVQMPDQTTLQRCGKPSAERLADAGLFMECVEEELAPWQQTPDNKEPERVESLQRIRTVKQVTRKPAVVTRLLAPAPAPGPAPAPAPGPGPAPAPVASTHMVLSGQALSGNRVSSKDTVVPLLTNTLTGTPAVVNRVFAPAFTPALAPVPAPASVASTHMVLSGQVLSGNRVSSKDTAVSLFTNTSSLPTPMASVPVTSLPSGFLLVVKQF
ncbi:uncharacterized protein LOC134082533 isoform X2 [Sardina pilchardus]|uniref:uncharacterized protein LOC134082533 isoform X2 n=1 Tax=Sardina pilchardus TaxID=27697 RepID=UPI002E0E4510